MAGALTLVLALGEDADGGIGSRPIGVLVILGDRTRAGLCRPIFESKHIEPRNPRIKHSLSYRHRCTPLLLSCAWAKAA